MVDSLDYTMDKQSGNDCPYICSEDLSIDSSMSDSQLNIMHFNVCSIVKNLAEVKLMLDSLQQGNVTVDMLLMCETFTHGQNISFADIPGYQLVNRN